MSPRTQFLQTTVAHYTALGVKIERLITDNGSAYRPRPFNNTCQAMWASSPPASRLAGNKLLQLHT